jgi:hypothetical protein
VGYRLAEHPWPVLGVFEEIAEAVDGLEFSSEIQKVVRL